jgi:hypothetical protein
MFDDRIPVECERKAETHQPWTVRSKEEGDLIRKGCRAAFRRRHSKFHGAMGINVYLVSENRP